MTESCVFSVVGAHAGEELAAIFNRKAHDVATIGRTFWLFRSHKCNPIDVQCVCSTQRTRVLFLAPTSVGGARPTVEREAATEYSVDGRLWGLLPEGLSPVTGKLGVSSCALVIGSLDLRCSETVDLWGYGEAVSPRSPVRFMLGASTICAVGSDTSSLDSRAKSRFRSVLASATLVAPYCVWVR